MSEPGKDEHWCSEFVATAHTVAKRLSRLERRFRWPFDSVPKVSTAFTLKRMNTTKNFLLAASLTMATVPTVAVAQTMTQNTTTATPHKSFIQRHPKTSILLGAAAAYLLYRKLHKTCPPMSDTQAMNDPKYAKCFPAHR